MSGYVNPAQQQGIFPAQATTTDTADHEILPAPGPGLAWMITTVIVCNSHASTGSYVNLKSTTRTWGNLPAPAGYGGSIPDLPKPVPFGENEAVKIASSVSVTTILVSVIAYKTSAGQA